MPLSCPKCPSRILSPATVRETSVDHCSDCGGIWFDETELVRLLDLPPSSLRPLLGHGAVPGSDQRSARCPRDGATLLRVYSTVNSEIVVDACPTCRGIWLDGGELDRLRR